MSTHAIFRVLQRTDTVYKRSPVELQNFHAATLPLDDYLLIGSCKKQSH